MGFLDLVKSRNKELEFMLDFDLIEDTSKKIHMKQLSIQPCINMIGRTISQSEFYASHSSTPVPLEKSKFHNDQSFLKKNLKSAGEESILINLFSKWILFIKRKKWVCEIFFD
ncbi:hypothetical protein ASG99_24550 [Bacillus sp. Soil768D1]|nr:hypothetical protein ASG99_24550 [Bacillus sp. Soil768D1]